MQEKLQPHHFFISYISEEYYVAVKINEKLLKLGYKTFFDRESLNPGDSWENKIKDAINICSFFLLIWSDKIGSREESFVPVELNLAKTRAEKIINKGRFIIPILVGNNANFPNSFNVSEYQIHQFPDNPNDHDIDQFVIKLVQHVGHPNNYLGISTKADGKLGDVLKKINQEHSSIFDQFRLLTPIYKADKYDENHWINAACQRTDHIGDGVKKTIYENSKEINIAIRYLSEWMLQEMVVRVIGAGRAKLAATISANRLSHGGARVYIQDSVVPMPHDVKGGGVIAASASGRTPSVLELLRAISKKSNQQNLGNHPFKVIGIASENAREFAELCDVFIGIRLSRLPNPLRALADIEEMIICQVLDAMVAAAGEYLGFDDIKWRLGHENLGKTGPYDASGNTTHPPHAPHELK